SKIAESLKQSGAKYAVLRPLALDTPGGAMLTAQDFKLKESGKWIGGSGSLGAILNSKHKPPPVISKPSAPTYASMNLAADRLAKAAATGESFSGVVSNLRHLPGVVIDPSS